MLLFARSYMCVCAQSRAHHKFEVPSNATWRTQYLFVSVCMRRTRHTFNDTKFAITAAVAHNTKMAPQLNVISSNVYVICTYVVHFICVCMYNVYIAVYSRMFGPKKEEITLYGENIKGREWRIYMYGSFGKAFASSFVYWSNFAASFFKSARFK